MSTIADALTWDGSKATLSLFVVGPQTLEAGEPDLQGLPAFRLRRYLLDDVLGVLPGGALVEYDFLFEVLPRDLCGCLEMLLTWAMSSGAVVAWFGFEGSFHFDHLLSADIADQVYAVADEEGISLAGDADLPSMAWRQRVVSAGRRAGIARAR
jgi:hypothetical protein